MKEIGILEEDLLVLVVHEEDKEAAIEDNDNNAVAFAVRDNTRMDVKKRRAVYHQRRKKEDSFWLTQNLIPEAKVEMEADPDGRLGTRFCRNFRVPFNMFNEILLPMAKQRWWPFWHAEQVDECRRLVGDLEL